MEQWGDPDVSLPESGDTVFWRINELLYEE